jgi:neurofibromin 1
LDPNEDIEENRRNLIALTQTVFDAIISSSDKYDLFSLIFRNLMQADYFILSFAVGSQLKDNLMADEMFL